MKKLILMSIGSLLLASQLSVSALAVWPPSTSMTPEAMSESEAKAGTLEVTSETSVRARQIVDKLEEDERRLEDVLAQLEADRKKLKEAQDGHPVR